MAEKTNMKKWAGVKADVLALSSESTWDNIYLAIDSLESLGGGDIFHVTIFSTHCDIYCRGAVVVLTAHLSPEGKNYSQRKKDFTIEALKEFLTWFEEKCKVR